MIDDWELVRSYPGQVEWSVYHDIREQVLWAARGRAGYNRHHPDDVKENHYPLLLLDPEGQGVATVRLDHIPLSAMGIIRLVAVRSDRQRRGIGRILSQEWEKFAHKRQVRVLLTNAAKDAVPFYQRMYWSSYEWDTSDEGAGNGEAVQMRKLLHRSP